MKMVSADVQIIGGGVIGAAVAFRLSTAGLSIRLIDAADSLGAGATAAAIGGVTPQSETFCRGPLREVATWSTELFPDFCAQVEDRSGISIPILSTGQLEVALTEDDFDHLVNELTPTWTDEGFVTIVLDRKETLAEEPLLSPSVVGSLLLPIELAMEPKALIDGFARSFAASGGVSLDLQRNVTHITEGSDEVTVHFSDGTEASSSFVVICAGLRSVELLPFLADRLYPMKGQALEYRASPAGYPLRHHVYCANGGPTRSAYMVPRSDGRVTAGVTYEPEVNSNSLNRIPEVQAGIAELCPVTRTWPVLRAWAGVRPASRDGRPYIGYVRGSSHIICCSGHQGLGVTLAPISAHLVSHLILTEPASYDVRTRSALLICDPHRDLSGAGCWTPLEGRPVQ